MHSAMCAKAAANARANSSNSIDITEPEVFLPLLTRSSAPHSGRPGNLVSNWRAPTLIHRERFSVSSRHFNTTSRSEHPARLEARSRCLLAFSKPQRCQITKNHVFWAIVTGVSLHLLTFAPRRSLNCRGHISKHGTTQFARNALLLACLSPRYLHVKTAFGDAPHPVSR